MEKEYVKIGKAVQLEDGLYFQFDNSGEGDIFKDGYAYKHDYAAPCYVPENSRDEYNDRYPEYDCKAEDCLWYSHNDLLKLCFHNNKMCDDLFACLRWESPDVVIERMENEDFGHFWSFVQPGARVRWCGPMQLAGTYTVITEIDKFIGCELDEVIEIQDENGDIYQALLHELRDPATCCMTYWRMFQIPSYAVCAIEYGDYSGVDEEDIDNIKKFLDMVYQMCPKGCTFDWDKETLDSPYFCSRPEFGLACDVVELKIYKNL